MKNLHGIMFFAHCMVGGLQGASQDELILGFSDQSTQTYVKNALIAISPLVQCAYEETKEYSQSDNNILELALTSSQWDLIKPYLSYKSKEALKKDIQKDNKQVGWATLANSAFYLETALLQHTMHEIIPEDIFHDVCRETLLRNAKHPYYSIKDPKLNELMCATFINRQDLGAQEKNKISFNGNDLLSKQRSNSDTVAIIYNAQGLTKIVTYNMQTKKVTSGIEYKDKNCIQYFDNNKNFTNFYTHPLTIPSFWPKDGPHGSVALFGMHPEGKCCFTVFENSQICFWKVDALTLIKNDQLPQNPYIRHLFYAPNGKYLIGAFNNNTIQIYPLDDDGSCLVSKVKPTITYTFEGYHGKKRGNCLIDQIVTDRKGEYVACLCGSSDLVAIHIPTKMITTASVGDDYKQLCTLNETNIVACFSKNIPTHAPVAYAISVWDIKNNSEKILPYSGYDISAMQFNPVYDSLLAIGDLRGTVFIIDLHKECKLRVLNQLPLRSHQLESNIDSVLPILAIHFSLDGETIGCTTEKKVQFKHIKKINAYIMQKKLDALVKHYKELEEQPENINLSNYALGIANTCNRRCEAIALCAFVSCLMSLLITGISVGVAVSE